MDKGVRYRSAAGSQSCSLGHTDLLCCLLVTSIYKLHLASLTSPPSPISFVPFLLVPSVFLPSGSCQPLVPPRAEAIFLFGASITAAAAVLTYYRNLLASPDGLG